LQFWLTAHTLINQIFGNTGAIRTSCIHDRVAGSA